MLLFLFAQSAAAHSLIIPPISTDALTYQEPSSHEDAWWLWGLGAGYAACVAADISTSAYSAGAQKGYERNVLYQDVEHDPFRFGLRRAALSFGPGAAAILLHKKGGKVGRRLSAIVLAAGGVAACAAAINNDAILDDARRVGR